MRSAGRCGPPLDVTGPFVGGLEIRTLGFQVTVKTPAIRAAQTNPAISAAMVEGE